MWLDSIRDKYSGHLSDASDDPLEDVAPLEEGTEQWCPEPEEDLDWSVLDMRAERLQKVIPALTPSQFTELAFRMPRADGFGYENFSFDGRRHMRRPYDTNARRVLLVAARQVEKSCVLCTQVSMADGSRKEAGDVVVGDRVCTLRDANDVDMTTGEVTWVSVRYMKPCVRITSRQGHVVEVATTHPMRKFGAWVKAGELVVGDRLGVVRRCGEFVGDSMPKERIRLTAYMIGDGCLSQPQLRFTSLPGAKLDEFIADLERTNGTCTVRSSRSRAMDVALHKNCAIYGWLQEDGLLGHKSATKFVPRWVFRLSREDTALFLNRLWSTDGHVKKNGQTKYSIEYCSISKRLIRDVQALLWKFGIPSKIRTNWPNIYKKRGELKFAYILRIETQAGITAFLREVGALGKSEGVEVPEGRGNNNRDTYPFEINGLVRRVIASNPRTRKGPLAKEGSLRSAGLRETLEYPLTRDKLAIYLDFFASDPGYDWELVKELGYHLKSDLYWDEVVSIEDLGEQVCVDFEVADHHNFVADGFITHNSTLLGNRAITYCCLLQGYKVLYVSPSATQTKTFSVDRIKDPLETSDVLRTFSASAIQQNVFEKQFVNRSKITLRYAFLNADRCAVGSTRVHFSDGSVATLEEIYRRKEDFLGRWVWSAHASKLCVTPAQLLDVVDQGVRAVYRIRVEGGAELVCTDNQPLLTWDGWKRLDELKVGELVAVPRCLPHGVGNAIPLEEYRLVGYLLGDGATKTFNGVAFFTCYTRVLQEFRRCAKALGAVLGRVQDSNRKKWAAAKTRRQGIYGGAKGYKSRLRELGLIGKNHETKRVPEVFFTGNQEQICNFLGAIYATDGWASVAKEQYEIGYCSNSRGLLVDLQMLLLRFGIRSFLSRRKKPSTKKAKGVYTLSIRDAQSVRTFCASIPVLGKESEFRRVLRAARRVEKKKDDTDRIPLSYPALRVYLQRTYGLSTHAAWVQHRIQLRPGNTKDSVGRRVLRSIAEKLGDRYLAGLANTGLGWARLVSGTYEGQERTYDLTINATENYLVDGLFIHNTRGVPAWALLLDELQDIMGDNIPVIEQCTSHAPEEWKSFFYSGTPKSTDNTIEYYRSGVDKNGRPMSTMGEWAVPCDSCGNKAGFRYWNILGEKNIGKKSLICERCGKPISPAHDDAQWVELISGGIYESYRIPQLMVPWRSWDEILLDYSRYPRDKFYNEVLGLSYDSGMRPLSRADILRCCNADVRMTQEALNWYRQHGVGTPIFAGADWGCHDEETRILTDRGFKYFRDLRPDDLVAQWDPDSREMSFVRPRAVTVREWNEPLLQMRTKGGVDLKVTHTHRMRVGVSQGDRWVTESAGDLAVRGGNVKFVGYVTWQGEERETFVLPGLPRSSGYQGSENRTFHMDDWLELLGYLITEGGVCFTRNRPDCIKMSQRETVNYETYKKMQACLDRMAIPFSAFPNRKTGDVNWSIYGKQYWSWYLDNIGSEPSEKRLPREFLALSSRQLRILFQALVDGDGYTDPREGCTGGAFYSTSKGLCEDFQELCIRLGMRCVVRLHKPAEGNRRTRWRAIWSEGKDYQLNTPSSSIERVPYNGRVYCCAVPSGYIVTERNGCISYQGNTGENAYTVLSLGTYVNNKFRIFYIHRFVGEETDVELQKKLIVDTLRYYNVRVVGADYGGGYHPNDHLVRVFGQARIQKYQYLPRSKRKVFFSKEHRRWMVHRTDAMTDLFNAIKRQQIELPCWQDFQEPYAQDMLNIYSEYNETLRMLQYTHKPDRPDDSFHSILYCFLASMLLYPRPDIMAPTKEDPKRGPIQSGYEGTVDQS